MEFSKAQNEAISTKDVNIIVSASAGAGKTTVLVERLMRRMFVDGVSLDEILAMTFTEAAAGNMKKKLIKSLNKKIADPHLTEQEKLFCQKQQILVQNALICTIHSFSQSVIRNNYAAIGLNPEIIENIIDEVSSYKLENQVLKEILNDELKNNFTQYNDLLKYISSDIYHVDTLNKYLLQISRTARNTIDENEWYQKILNLNSEVSSFNEIPRIFTTAYLNDFRIKIKKTISYLQILQEMSASSEKGEPQLISQIINNLVEANDNLDSDYRLAISKIKIALNVKIKSIPKFDEYKEVRNLILNDSYQDLLDFLIEYQSIVLRFNDTAKFNRYLLILAEKLSNKFQKLKVQNVCMDFSDMEHYAYQILKANNFEVAKDYQNKFKEIMVDEFQDTNDIQNAMVELITNGHNIFRVGDMKQSIYKFRGAKPTIMQNLIHDETIKKIYLPNNYRSSANIVGFNNLVFNDLLQDVNVNIDFTDLDEQITDRDYQFEDLATIDLISFDKVTEKNQVKTNLAASWICKDIIEKVNSGKYQFKDLCVLVRGHADKIDLKYELNLANIPNFVDDHQGFLKSYASSIVMNYFKIILDPKDNIAFTSILTSPIYNFSDNDLVEHFAGYSYYQTLTDINHKVIEDYEKLKATYYTQGILALFNELMNLNNYYHSKISKQEKVDLDLFVDNIINFKSNSLVLFLDYLEIAKEETKIDAIPISNEANVVKVMTIHHSKGLEFEVCYLYAPNRSKLVKAQNNLVIDEKLGIGINYVKDLYLTNTSLQKQAIIHQNQIDELSEFIRVFYVATTRAKNRLYIVENNGQNTEFSKKDISVKLNDLISFTDLLAATSIHNSELFSHQHLSSIEVSCYDYLPLITQLKREIKVNQKKTENINHLTPSKHSTDIVLNLSKGQEIGTLYHKAMETIPFKENVTIEIIQNLNRKLSTEQINKVFECYNSDFFQSLLTKDYHCEYNFTSLKDNILKTGIVDFFATDENCVYIIDYKTDINVDETVLIERYQTQLQEYSKTFSLIYPDKLINTYIYSFNMGKFIEIK